MSEETTKRAFIGDAVNLVDNEAIAVDSKQSIVTNLRATTQGPSELVSLNLGVENNYVSFTIIESDADGKGFYNSTYYYPKKASYFRKIYSLITDPKGGTIYGVSAVHIFNQMSNRKTVITNDQLTEAKISIQGEVTTALILENFLTKYTAL
tara:strand:- start:895 stop:1350 length:456 start_codon:yes stop_codon:yes gene_type:complete